VRRDAQHRNVRQTCYTKSDSKGSHSMPAVEWQSKERDTTDCYHLPHWRRTVALGSSAIQFLRHRRSDRRTR
jgi:hypothetical protein